MSSYAAVLRTPHALSTFAAALLGRLSYPMVSLSLVLAVKDASGSFAVAGGTLALFGASGVALSPVRAALVDRYGPRGGLVPMAVLYAALLTVLALVTRDSAGPGGSGGAGTVGTGAVPGVLLGVPAACAGACTPPLGPTMRTLWSQLLPDRRMLRRAYSLDGVAEELLLVVGPCSSGSWWRTWSRRPRSPPPPRSYWWGRSRSHCHPSRSRSGPRPGPKRLGVGGRAAVSATAPGNAVSGSRCWPPPGSGSVWAGSNCW
ncbi:hypothetical protein GCM10011583_08190 [Streptomyces camponoticapitis]|uniref:Major facilitator superfamily (MFS) profile domain-containing protein n=1 Tax=Streptomyces camponoticapitis TaxID=1616125 RepID=A0ABQ2DYE0_9ACTN|nr:hypothetical protein GCM10011583_08190 [Streptomyces camponoticapitis]